MNAVITGQVRFLLVTTLLGMGIIFAYDGCRFLRWLIPHRKFVVAVEDVLFWMGASIPAYALFYVYNDGEIRWYGVLAVLLGCFLYEKGISSPVRRFGMKHMEKPKRKLYGVLGKLARKIGKMRGKVHKKFKKKLQNIEK